MIYTNKNDISVEMAVALLHDEYDYIEADNYISATALMKPLRHIILPSRIPPADRIIPDVTDLIPTFLGTSLHSAIELAWSGGRHVRALELLGYPQSVIDRVLVNPTPEQLKAIQNPIPVYIEQRAFRQIDGFTVGGKYDMICEGRVTDTKSTSVYTWIHGSKDDDYQLQGSIYRWLNLDKVTQDHIRINFIFTDWNKTDAAYKTANGYPPRRMMHRDFELLSVAETNAWIREKLAQITKHRETPEKELPECTPEELWMSEPKYKYYADPTKTAGRSTKNFDTMAEAQAFMAEKGKGVVITVPGTPKRCDYCAAYPICTQKDKYRYD